MSEETVEEIQKEAEPKPNVEPASQKEVLAPRRISLPPQRRMSKSATNLLPSPPSPPTAETPPHRPARKPLPPIPQQATTADNTNNANDQDYTNPRNTLTTTSEPANFVHRPPTAVAAIRKTDIHMKSQWTKSTEISPELASALKEDLQKESEYLIKTSGDDSGGGDTGKVQIKSEWSKGAQGKVAKKLEKAAKKVEKEKEMGGKDALKVQEENERLSVWCKLLEKEQKENRANIERLKEEINNVKMGTMNQEQKYYDLRRRLFEAEALIHKAVELYETIDRSDPFENAQ